MGGNAEGLLCTKLGAGRFICIFTPISYNSVQLLYPVRQLGLREVKQLAQHYIANILVSIQSGKQNCVCVCVCVCL